MSVREDLAKILAGGHITSDSIMWAVADELLKAHAHELAGQIREFVGPESYPHETNELTLRYVKGWRDAADYIDPKVKK